MHLPQVTILASLVMVVGVMAIPVEQEARGRMKPPASLGPPPTPPGVTNSKQAKAQTKPYDPLKDPKVEKMMFGGKVFTDIVAPLDENGVDFGQHQILVDRYDRERKQKSVIGPTPADKWAGSPETDPYFVADLNDQQMSLAEYATAQFYRCMQDPKVAAMMPEYCFVEAVDNSGGCQPMISVDRRYPAKVGPELPAQKVTTNTPVMKKHCHDTRLGAWRQATKAKAGWKERIRQIMGGDRTLS
ncbi:MAG: hypothetical protein M1823_003051 [Watsoniomyces obsoletus]|nr:MAG: hypothetical protein M1823_003051 [Watsoniomyces obsoletus]